MKIRKSKRLKVLIGGLIANYIIGIIGIAYGSDLFQLGTFLALANAPLYAYILGETYRPSKSE